MCLFISFVFIASCNFSTLEGRTAISQGIRDSKKRDIFIREYQGLTNPVIINDTLSIYITSAWLERQWRYSDDYTSYEDGYQLIVETKEKIGKDYSFDWLIGTESKRHFGSCGENCIVMMLDSLPTNEKETWQVQSGGDVYPEDRKIIIIGTFTLIKK